MHFTLQLAPHTTAKTASLHYNKNFTQLLALNTRAQTGTLQYSLNLNFTQLLQQAVYTKAKTDILDYSTIQTLLITAETTILHYH